MTKCGMKYNDRQQTSLSKSLSISMKEAVGLCSGSKLAVGSIVSVLVTVNECLRVESEVPPSDNTTGITAVLINRNNNNHSTLHWLQYLVTMSSDTRLDSRGAEWK